MLKLEYFRICIGFLFNVLSISPFINDFEITSVIGFFTFGLNVGIQALTNLSKNQILCTDLLHGVIKVPVKSFYSTSLQMYNVITMLHFLTGFV